MPYLFLKVRLFGLKDMQILYDGVQREDTKDSIYFNQIQTHKHHTNEIDPSVYLYSFFDISWYLA